MLLEIPKSQGTNEAGRTITWPAGYVICTEAEGDSEIKGVITQGSGEIKATNDRITQALLTTREKDTSLFSVFEDRYSQVPFLQQTENRHSVCFLCRLPYLWAWLLYRFSLSVFYF